MTGRDGLLAVWNACGYYRADRRPSAIRRAPRPPPPPGRRCPGGRRAGPPRARRPRRGSRSGAWPAPGARPRPGRRARRWDPFRDELTGGLRGRCGCGGIGHRRPRRVGLGRERTQGAAKARRRAAGARLQDTRTPVSGDPRDSRRAGGASVVAMTDRWARPRHASMVLAGMLAWMTVMGVASRPSMSAARRAGFAAALLAIWAHIEAITSRPRPA
jgi:hypothetical protein